MREFINRHGYIVTEYPMSPEKNYKPFKNGRYFVMFNFNEIAAIATAISNNKYNAYKEIIKEIKKNINQKE